MPCLYLGGARTRPKVGRLDLTGGFLSLLRFNICTFSFLVVVVVVVVVTIPQPNLCGAYMPFRGMVPPPRGAQMTLSLTGQALPLSFVVTTQVFAGPRNALLYLPSVSRL